MHRIHNSRYRMPLILRNEDEERWLDPRLTDAEIAEFFTPPPGSKMQCEIIRSDFLRKDAGDPTILTPAAQP